LEDGGDEIKGVKVWHMIGGIDSCVGWGVAAVLDGIGAFGQ
jgi:hypothetical protein